MATKKESKKEASPKKGKNKLIILLLLVLISLLLCCGCYMFARDSFKLVSNPDNDITASVTPTPADQKPEDDKSIVDVICSPFTQALDDLFGAIGDVFGSVTKISQ